MFGNLNWRGVLASVRACVVAVCFSLLCVPAARGQFHVYEGQSIQEAIDWVWDGVEIIVHPGTYYESIDLLGKAITVRSENPDDPQVVQSTIIDGDGAYHVVRCGSGETPDTIIAGFTITGGNANGDPLDDCCGGGVCCYENSSPTLNSCIISDNMAAFGGGVSCRESSSPTLTNCTISDNRVFWAHGGGVYCQHNCDPVMTNCAVSGNSAGLCGGGVCCQFTCSPTLINCTISGNSAEYFGGGVSGYGGDATLTSCTILGNSASAGGGLAFWGGSSTLTNCMIWNNEAGQGGGVQCDYNCNSILTNCTIFGNETDQGGGVSCGGSAIATLTNCILWADIPQEIFLEGDGAVIATFCNVQGGWEGQGNIDADPLFVDPDNADFRLAPGSPCIDAADSTAVPDGITTDLDGNPRFFDDPSTPDTGIGSPCVDMGALEFQGSDCPADVTGDEVVDIDDLFGVLAHWGEGAGIYDVNNDGIVDIDDVFAILAEWGPCP